MSANQPLLTGRLRKYHSNFYYVEADGVEYECALRGLIKKEGTEPLVGDFVELDSVQPHSKTARIHRVLPRKNTISRPKLANVDQVFIVYSLKEPDFDPHQLDRYLTHVELAGLEPILCLSKADLAADQQELKTLEALYGQQLGYKLVFSSVRQLDTLAPLRLLAQGKISVLAGPSGSGKSSLLNALNPALRLRVGDVSEKISRGQHTTRHVELLTLFAEELDTLVADTPGFSHLKLNYVLPERLREVFREFAPYQVQCAYTNCLHVDEEDCAVLAHRDQIASSRYQSYLDMLAEARQYKETIHSSSQKAEFGYKQLDRKGKEALRILRLKEKNRDASRRVVRQQVSQLEGQLPESDWPDMD